MRRDLAARGPIVPWLFSVAFALALLGLALVASVAPAATKTERPLLFSFDPGLLTAQSIAVDDATGAVYVTESEAPGGFESVGSHPLSLKKFHADGTPWNFTATGSNVLPLYSNRATVAVDNTGGPTQGDIYVAEPSNQKVLSSESQQLVAYNPDGSLRWRASSPGGQPIQVAVDAAGHLWTFGQSSFSGPNVREYDPSTNPPTEISSFNAGEAPGELDSAGALYVAGFKFSGGVSTYTLEKWVNGAFDSTLSSGPSVKSDAVRDISVDQSNPAGHIFSSHRDSLQEFEASGTEVGRFGGEYLGGSNLEFGAREARSIAYNATLGRLYMLSGTERSEELGLGKPKVLVFGAQQSGTEAAVTANAPTAVGVSGAHLSGTVNPENTSVEWHFEWKTPVQSWAVAGSSPAQALPNDALTHEVELDTNALRGNTSYQVRLVAVDTATHLASFSNLVSLTTTAATAAPVVTIAAPSNITTGSAKISGTIDPEGDTADWKVQLSKGAGCADSFVDQSIGQIEEGSNSPVPVEATVTALLPAERYCARILAANSAGTTTSETKEFETLEVAPTQVFAAFVAPRTDTTARINGYVNPEGSEAVTYRFEYSSDGGTTWTELPDGEDTSEARTPVVVSAELTGLQPQTTYSYRVTAENPAGGETSQPLSFTTRSTAEVTLPTRGVELVNSPDKGTQNVVSAFSAMQEPPISEDGEKALWSVFAGAPGGHNSAHALFLAERTPSGWTSHSVQPSASAQVKGGELSYFLDAITPDLSHFVMAVERPEVFSYPTYAALVRLDDAENQAVLTQESRSLFRSVDLTEDAGHVLLIANAEGQLENAKGQLVDVGSGSPEVVSIMPDGTESECLLENGGSFTGGQERGYSAGPAANWRPGYHLINTHDASIVYFETHPNGDCSAKQRLYVRNRTTEQTTLIDPGTSKGEPTFMRTTPDGRYGYFDTYSQLDPADTNSGRDIYRWDEESQESTCLTCVVADAQVGPSIISDDFSRIYFQSQQQLIAGKGTEGGENVYLLHEGALSFVATVEFADVHLRESVLSADGADLLFVAKAGPGLTSDAVGTPTGCHYPNGGDESSATGPCAELYRYEADQHSIECLSCARNATTTFGVGSPGLGSGNDFRMSADGSTVAFATKEPLVRADVNRNTDIYEWHNGSIRLVTDGVTVFQESVAAPQVNAVDRDGKNIFFSVVEPGLTGYEQDEFLNFYDARVGGGFPRPTPVVHCSEESCQGPLQAPPLQGAAGSASLSGAGNEKPQPKARCRKGQARRHGRCVKRHTHKKRAPHGKRGGSK